MISLATSKITKKVRENINASLNENRIGGGRFVQEFENKVKDYIGTEYAVAVNNGSMADLVAIATLKAMRPEKTEVILPALTFTAQAAAVVHNGLDPIFVDVHAPDHEYAYQMNVDELEEHYINEDTLAIMAVHLLGKECELEKLRDICKRNDIFLMEDCCEAYGGKHKDSRSFGTTSSAGTFSFFPSHTITTGEGGMIVTNDKLVYDLAVKLRNHGRLSDEITEKFHFSHIGFNGKMSNVLAAIGCAVADSADKVITKRQYNVEFINKTLKKDWFASSPHCYPIQYKTERERDEALRTLEENGVEARKLFSSLPTQEGAYEMFGYPKGSFPEAEKIGKTCLFVPIHQDLSIEDLEKICALV